MKRGSFRPAALLALALLLAASCNEVNVPLPAAPEPLPPAAPSQFSISGHWEGLSNQGRRLAFDVSEQGVVHDGRINLHHDCSAGRLRMTIDGYETQVSGDAFSTTLHWRIDDQGQIYVGEVTVSGRFESDGFAKGGFVNSVTEKPTSDVYGVCFPVHGTWEAGKE